MKSNSPSIEVVIRIRNRAIDQLFSSHLTYEIGDVVDIVIDVTNNSEEEITHLFISHMLRDAVMYVPNSLKPELGTADLLFRIMRWRIVTLKSGGLAVLTFQVKVGNESSNASIPFSASYTYQRQNVSYGTYEAIGASLEKRNL